MKTRIDFVLRLALVLTVIGATLTMAQQSPTEAGIVIASTDFDRIMERVNNLVELQGSEGLVIAITP